MKCVNRIHMINRKAFVDNVINMRNSSLTFEKQNYAIHDALHDVLIDHMAKDVILITCEYINEHHTVEYVIQYASDTHIYIMLTQQDGDLNFNYTIDVQPHHVSIKHNKHFDSLNDGIVSIDQKWLEGSSNHSNAPYIQNSIYTDFFNDYMYQYYGKIDYLSEHTTYNRPFNNTFEYVLVNTRWLLAVFYVTCQVIDHKKLKIIIIMLKMIKDTIQRILRKN